MVSIPAVLPEGGPVPPAIPSIGAGIDFAALLAKAGASPACQAPPSGALLQIPIAAEDNGETVDMDERGDAGDGEAPPLPSEPIAIPFLAVPSLGATVPPPESALPSGAAPASRPLSLAVSEGTFSQQPSALAQPPVAGAEERPVEIAGPSVPDLLDAIAGEVPRPSGLEIAQQFPDAGRSQSVRSAATPGPSLAGMSPGPRIEDLIPPSVEMALDSVTFSVRPRVLGPLEVTIARNGEGQTLQLGVDTVQAERIVRQAEAYFVANSSFVQVSVALGSEQQRERVARAFPVTTQPKADPGRPTEPALPTRGRYA